MDEEVPEAIREYWPKLKMLLETEIINTASEAYDKEGSSPNFEQIGIGVVACQKLLRRFEKAHI